MADETDNEQAMETAERRHLTVLFCDLVDSSTLAARLDPEDLREVYGAYREVCREAVERFDGHIEQVVGDGMLISFGYPQAHEDDATLAVFAGMEIIKGVERLSGGFRARLGEEVAVRVAIHTGLVVVGEMGKGDTYQSSAVVGNTTIIVARLQEQAAPDSVLVTAATQRLLGPEVLTEPVGPLSLKGVDGPIQTFKVLKVRDVGARDTDYAAPDDKVMVDRRSEMETLQQHWTRAQAWHGGCVAIVGEAGIGKSRLVRAFLDSVRDEPARIRHYCCSEHHQNVAYYPVLDRIQRNYGWRRGLEDPHQTDELLEKELREIGVHENEIELIFTTVLARPAKDAEQQLDAHERRRRTRRTLLNILTGPDLTTQEPSVIVVEDLHWVDPSSRELLEGLVELVSDRPILVLVTSRSVESLGELVNRRIAIVGLERLPEEHCRELCLQVAGDSLPVRVIEQISKRSEGVPLYAEELTSAVAEEGHAERMELPSSLHGSIMARLDRLGEAKRIAQLAAVQGRVFNRTILGEVSGLERETLARGLDRLADSGLIIRSRLESGDQYEFKHSLVADVAYESFLKRTRRQVHLRIAQAYRNLGSQAVDAEPDILAYHYTKAEQPEEALRYWRLAGERSVLQSANKEAVAQFGNAQQQLQRIPPGKERDALELQLCVAMLGPMIASYGYGMPEVEKTVERALTLAGGIEGAKPVFPILYTQWSYKQVTGKIRDAYELARQFMEKANAQDNAAPKAIGHRLLGTSMLLVGRPREAEAHLKQSIELYVPSAHARLAYVYGSDIRVMNLCYLAFVRWLTGEIEDGVACADEAVERAMKMDHANNIGYAMTHAAIFLTVKRDLAQVEAMSTRLLEFATERELPFWIANARAFTGWILTQQGKPHEALAFLVAGLEFLEAANLVYWRPTYFGWMAEAHSANGDFAAARDRLRQAQAIVDAGGERWAESELWRIRGEIEHADGNADSACAHLQRAIGIARDQDALSFVLRSTVSLARVLHELGRGDEATPMLQAALAPFAGLTPQHDQQEALALLA